jgi:hypothetical protein
MLKFVLHLNDSGFPGHTDTSPDGDSINCDTKVAEYNVKYTKFMPL